MVQIVARTVVAIAIAILCGNADGQQIGSFHINVTEDDYYSGYRVQVNDGEKVHSQHRPMVASYSYRYGFEVLVLQTFTGGTGCPAITYIFHKAGDSDTSHIVAESCSDFFEVVGRHGFEVRVADWSVAIGRGGFEEPSRGPPTSEAPLQRQAARGRPATNPIRPTQEPFGRYEMDGAVFSIRPSSMAPSSASGSVARIERIVGSPLIVLEVHEYGTSNLRDYLGVAFFPLAESPPTWAAPRDQTFSGRDMICWGQDMAPAFLVGSFCLALNDLNDQPIRRGQAFFIAAEYGQVQTQLVRRLGD